MSDDNKTSLTDLPILESVDGQKIRLTKRERDWLEKRLTSRGEALGEINTLDDYRYALFRALSDATIEKMLLSMERE